jgi:hypothetical protein
MLGRIVTDFPWRELEDIPPQEYFAYPYYPRGQSALLIGAGGTGKSLLAVAEALAIVTGRPEIAGWPQGAVKQRCNVLYLSDYDDVRTMRGRIAAACLKHGIDRSEINGANPGGFTFLVNHTFATGDDDGIILAHKDALGRPIVNQDTVKSLIQDMKRQKIGVLILDPIERFHRVTDESNLSMRAIVDAIQQIEDKTGACVMSITNSDEDEDDEPGYGEPDIHPMDSTFTGAMWSVRTMHDMPNASKALRSHAARWRDIFRVDDAKHKAAPLREEPRFFERQDIKSWGVAVPLDIKPAKSAAARKAA